MLQLINSVTSSFPKLHPAVCVFTGEVSQVCLGYVNLYLCRWVKLRLKLKSTKVVCVCIYICSLEQSS